MKTKRKRPLKTNSFLQVLLIFIFLLIIISGCIHKQEIQNENPNNQTNSDNENNETKTNNTENNTDSNSQSFIFKNGEITTYHITTTWTTGCCGVWEHHEKPGFYHNIPIWENASYNIQGTLKNTVDYNFQSITINISFLNETKNVLFDLNDLNKTLTILSLKSNEQTQFTIKINPLDHYYQTNADSFDESFETFQNVESLTFNITTKPATNKIL